MGGIQVFPAKLLRKGGDAVNGSLTEISVFFTIR
jgi:hypothetical protein